MPPVIAKPRPAAPVRHPAFPFDWDVERCEEPEEKVVVIVVEPEPDPVEPPTSVVIEPIAAVVSTSLATDVTRSNAARWTGREVALASLLAFCVGGLVVAEADRLPARETVSSSLRRLADKIESDRIETTSQLQRLRALVEARPSGKAPAPDLGPLSREIGSVKESITFLTATLPDSKRLGVKIDELGGRLDTLVADMSKPPVYERSAMRPADYVQAESALAAALYQHGVSVYAQGAYVDADAFFHASRVIEPSDPRSWYYGALALGYATNDWKVESVRLAREGVKREAVKPDAAEKVFAALSSLPAANGGDWIAFFRKATAPR